MKLIKWIFALAIVLLLVGWCNGDEPYGRYIAQKSNGWDTAVNLIPSKLAKHTERTETIKKLTRAGYEQEDLSSREAAEPMLGIWDPEVFYAANTGYVPGDIIFTRRYSTLICTNVYVIVLRFDENDKLRKAEGFAQTPGCI